MSYLHPELPPIAMIRADAEKLSRIADSSAGAFAQTADFLAREIDRAQVIEDFERRPGLVTMGSRVTFRDDVTGHVRTVKLVYPGEADVSQGTYFRADADRRGADRSVGQPVDRMGYAEWRPPLADGARGRRGELTRCLRYVRRRGDPATHWVPAIAGMT